jgi:hypothetical protein
VYPCTGGPCTPHPCSPIMTMRPKVPDSRAYQEHRLNQAGRKESHGCSRPPVSSLPAESRLSSDSKNGVDQAHSSQVEEPS